MPTNERNEYQHEEHSRPRGDYSRRSRDREFKKESATSASPSSNQRNPQEFGTSFPKKKGRYKRFSDRRRCRFCRENMGKIDYKDITTLKKLCTSQGKLYSRKRSGNCSYHQRSAKTAIKRARFLALMPYVGAI